MFKCGCGFIKTILFWQILGRTIRVDHCEQYRAPNADMSKIDEVTASIRIEGCAPIISPQQATEINVSLNNLTKMNQKCITMEPFILKT